MIELRYFTYNPPAPWAGVRKLQYRVRTNDMEIGIQPPIWGEWQDVPEVLEERAAAAEGKDK